MKTRISAFILSSILFICSVNAQEAQRAIKNILNRNAQPALLQGMALTVEVGSPLAYALGTDAMNGEAGLRLNFKNKYFPIGELGYSKYEKTHDDTQIHFKTAAPYLRIGVDVNMLRNKLQENRLMLGGRIGYSTYKYDVDGPDMPDPIWGTARPLKYEGLSSNRLWFELVFGMESEIFRHFHMGFSIRYKLKLHEKLPAEANAYYVPGFGNTDNGFRATYNLYFDLSKKIKNKTTE